MSDPAEIHPGPEAFRELLRGRSSATDTRVIVRHLLAGCGDCGRQVEAARQAQGDPRSWSYDSAFARLERELVGVPAAPAEPATAAVPHLRLVHSARTGGTRSSIRAAAREVVEEVEQPVLLRRAHKR